MGVVREIQESPEEERVLGEDDVVRDGRPSLMLILVMMALSLYVLAMIAGAFQTVADEGGGIPVPVRLSSR